MSTPLVQGGRPIAKFRVFGFPVTIDISFVVVAALLGYYPGVTARGFVVWLAMVPLAVLSHELGHAFVARPTGAEPAITLAGLGGVTTYVPPRRLSRGRSVAISLAGPAVGIVIGGGLLAYAATAGPTAGSLGATIVGTAIFTTLGWSVLNLLPILPLDGGHILPALWEAAKKRLARMRGRPDPGPVDMAKLMPIAYGFAILIMLYGGLVIVADIVNPIKLNL
jgi:Zn-dependent protease